MRARRCVRKLRHLCRIVEIISRTERPICTVDFHQVEKYGRCVIVSSLRMNSRKGTILRARVVSSEVCSKKKLSHRPTHTHVFKNMLMKTLLIACEATTVTVVVCTTRQAAAYEMGTKQIFLRLHMLRVSNRSSTLDHTVLAGPCLRWRGVTLTRTVSTNRQQGLN